MPRYDYQCESCGYVFEVMRKRTDPGPDVCPECGAAEPQKLLSPTSFQLKGSGWYVTDYRSPGLAKGVGTMPESITDAKSSEAKPEKAAESKAETPAAGGSASGSETISSPKTSESD